MDKPSNELWKLIKKNKLQITTIIMSILFITIYIIGTTYAIKNNMAINVILSMSANYVTICSFIIIVIQLISFVKDSRRKEHRSRKEAACKLADEYANELLNYMTFIENVLTRNYNKNNPLELKNKIIESDVKNFINKDVQNDPFWRGFSATYVGNENDIESDIICEVSVAMEVMEHSCGLFINNQLSQHALTIRFKLFISKTLNILESFSMTVIQNVAESEMLFDPLHFTFITFVKYMYPLISDFNGDEEVLYPNIISLFREWSYKKKEYDYIKDKNEKIKNKKNQKAKMNRSITL